jgi:hypothetical protein
VRDRESRIDNQLRRTKEQFDGMIEALSEQERLLTAQTQHLVSLRDESRARTMALRRMIDRLGPGDLRV